MRVADCDGHLSIAIARAVLEMHLSRAVSFLSEVE